MATVSLCMIVKNEEEVLARNLESSKGMVDEIIIVDTGSTDKTKEIALQYTDKVYDFKWIDDFGAARNFAFSKGTMDYLMWLDADDIILPEDAKAFKELMATLDPKIDTVMMKYNIAFDEQGNPTFTYFRERVMRRCPLARWEGSIHEVIAPFGNIIHADIAVTHKRKGKTDPLRNLNHFLRLKERGKKFSPREQFYFARELYYNARYDEAIAEFESFLDGGRGWVENNIEACRMLCLCYRGIKKNKEGRDALLRSFTYDSPRAEHCCDLGWYYFDEEKWEPAAFWYHAALGCKRNTEGGGFTLEECYGYLPHIQLCVCYDRLGEKEKASHHNEEAGKFKPDSPQVKGNRVYFRRILKTAALG
ncbi:MAG: glycosyltransferase family 2 protein [Oscillospiraceae bacterium]|jgi:glycosyltransferase involved in cell wall biosynthesis|nr:glycosyltransferase family 2 protein [Oscillospiraceae bacterium]